MSRALSPKVLRELRGFITGIDFTQAAKERWLAAINASLETRRGVAPARKRRAAKKETKAEETRRIRGTVFFLARSKCEVCGRPATDLEHAFGRVRVKQDASNCLALCRECHRARTNSTPSALHWWAAYRDIFRARNDEDSARLCEKKMDLCYSRAKGSEVMP